MAISDLYGWVPPMNQFPTQGAQAIPVGAYGQQAQGLLGDAMRTKPFGSSGAIGGAIGPAIGVDPGASSGGAGLMGPNGVLGGSASDNQRFASFGSGAAAGSKFGPWGALVGGLIGYGAAGGVKDANPIDASGFSGISMDDAWANQNIARLASNPAAALASKVGIGSNSVLGKALDPGGLFGGGKKSHKRNWSAFNEAFPGTTVNEQGNYVLPEQFGGAVVNQKQLDDLAGTWYGATYAPDGDQGGWQEKYNNVLTDLLSQPMYNDFGG
jgi:hypothetical protein